MHIGTTLTSQTETALIQNLASLSPKLYAPPTFIDYLGNHANAMSSRTTPFCPYLRTTNDHNLCLHLFAPPPPTSGISQDRSIRSLSSPPW